jgi:hypothetical protein
MAEISSQVLKQLEQAQAALVQSIETAGPPVASEVAIPETAPAVVGAAGSGQAQHVLVDHYFTSSLRRLWAYSGGWKYANITDAEEQGLAQVAFAASRVDVWWDDQNQLRQIRCWKTF